MTNAYFNMSDETFANAPEPDAEMEQELQAQEDATLAEEQQQPQEQQEEAPEEPISQEENVLSEEVPEQLSDSESTEQNQPETSQETQEIDYKAAYEQIMAPFKANGTTIELRSPEEAIQLMQKGANYTRKMQQLAPYRKTLLMLEKENLLDEGKLAFYADLEKKNPEAIKKFLKDSNIDPLDIDTTSEPNYVRQTQGVSDSEVSFNEIVKDISDMPNGYQTISAMEKFDEASKKILWEYPDTMRSIHQQRESGAYDLISKEVERQKLFGNISSDTPFLVAYKQVGEALVAQQEQMKARQAMQRKPIARGAMPQKQVDSRVKAAAPTKTSTKSAKTTINPLAMSDEDFMKQFGGY